MSSKRPLIAEGRELIYIVLLVLMIQDVSILFPLQSGEVSMTLSHVLYKIAPYRLGQADVYQADYLVGIHKNIWITKRLELIK